MERWTQGGISCDRAGTPSGSFTWSYAIPGNSFYQRFFPCLSQFLMSLSPARWSLSGHSIARCWGQAALWKVHAWGLASVASTSLQDQGFLFEEEGSPKSALKGKPVLPPLELGDCYQFMFSKSQYLLGSTLDGLVLDLNLLFTHVCIYFFTQRGPSIPCLCDALIPELGT